MATVFSDPIFSKTVLRTKDNKNSVVCTLRDDSSGRFIQELIRNDSKGFVKGYLVEPSRTPEWLVPGTILFGKVQELNLVLTLEPQIQSNIVGLSDILGDKLRFSYTVVTEFE